MMETDELSNLPGVEMVKLIPKIGTHHAQLFIVVREGSFADTWFGSFARPSGSSGVTGGTSHRNYTFSLVPAVGVPFENSTEVEPNSL